MSTAEVWPAGDLDQDGFEDAVVTCNGARVSLYAGAEKPGNAFALVLADASYLAATAGWDLDGDHVPDFLVARKAAVSLAFLGKSKAFQGVSRVQTRPSADQLSVSDDDGDGRPDVTSLSSGSGYWAGSDGTVNPNADGDPRSLEPVPVNKAARWVDLDLSRSQIAERLRAVPAVRAILPIGGREFWSEDYREGLSLFGHVFEYLAVFLPKRFVPAEHRVAPGLVLDVFGRELFQQCAHPSHDPLQQRELMEHQIGQDPFQCARTIECTILWIQERRSERIRSASFFYRQVRG
jgi:hypothetical protein